MPSAAPPHPTTLDWLLATPEVAIAVVAWVAVWLVLELLWLRRGLAPFDLREVGMSLRVAATVGTAQVAVSLLLIPLLWHVFPYRVATLSMTSAWHWLLAWVLVDFAYYWIHRGLHATRLGWSLHAPHHSIRQPTLLDSLRMSWGEQPVGVFAYGVPLVLLGVPPHIAGVFYVFVSLYQLIVHTEFDWTLGPLDAVVYTPAQHRSHHANERPESDRNFGGFFVVFDRMFGTFTPTDRHYRPARYGLPDGEADSYTAAAFGEMRRFALALRATRGVGARVRFAWTRP